MVIILLWIHHYHLQVFLLSILHKQIFHLLSVLKQEGNHFIADLPSLYQVIHISIDLIKDLPNLKSFVTLDDSFKRVNSLNMTSIVLFTIIESIFLIYSPLRLVFFLSVMQTNWNWKVLEKTWISIRSSSITLHNNTSEWFS